MSDVPCARMCWDSSGIVHIVKDVPCEFRCRRASSVVCIGHEVPFASAPLSIDFFTKDLILNCSGSKGIAFYMDLCLFVLRLLQSLLMFLCLLTGCGWNQMHERARRLRQGLKRRRLSIRIQRRPAARSSKSARTSLQSGDYSWQYYFLLNVMFGWEKWILHSPHHFAHIQCIRPEVLLGKNIKCVCDLHRRPRTWCQESEVRYQDICLYGANIHSHIFSFLKMRSCLRERHDCVESTCRCIRFHFMWSEARIVCWTLNLREVCASAQTFSVWF